VMLLFSPLFEVREARTHVSGLKPRIAPTLAAVGTHLTGRTFVPVARARLVDGVLENVPAFFHRAGAEIIARDREGGAEVHLAIRSNRKSTLTAGAFDKGLLSTTGLLLDVGPPVREQLLIDPDLHVGGKAILQRCLVAGDGGHDL